MTDLIPPFEGHPVAHTAVKITGRLVSDDLDGYVLKHDDVVQVLTQFRVIGVHHDTDEKTGEITRIQILRPIEMVLAPIDPDDPDDDGIIRAIPQVSQNRGLPPVKDDE
jgi:hypothetical protein